MVQTPSIKAAVKSAAPVHTAGKQSNGAPPAERARHLSATF